MESLEDSVCGASAGPMTLHTQIRDQLLASLSQPQADTPAHLNNALRLLSKWRSVLIQTLFS